MLSQPFTLQLNNAISKAAVGKFDGEHASLTCATSAGKVFFGRASDLAASEQLRFLNINRKISALACGVLDDKQGRDLLLVGAQTTLLAYDVRENCDLFFKDVPDGVNTLLVGRFGTLEIPLALVGGNCSIQGFDHDGGESFWTVTGDNVSAMAFCDVDGDGELELLVGSDDFEIRVFRNEEVVSETTETEKILALTALRLNTFGYALANGTVGVYEKPGQRRWRVKSKHEVTAISSFDLDGDGQPELISGWANGKFEVRSDRTGEVIYKDTLGAAVSAILQADYRCDGHTQVIVCSQDGEVRGYLPAGEGLGAADGAEGHVEEDTLRELYQRKQELAFELKQYEEHAKKHKGGERAAGLVAPDTKISARLVPAPAEGCLYLTLQSSNEARIKAAVVFAERVFEGESLAVHAKDPTTELGVPLRPPKDVAAELHVKALAGGRAMPVFHVFELTYQLPKFAMYVAADSSVVAPTAGVTFQLRERAKRVGLWLQEAFSVEPQQAADDVLDRAFISLRNGGALRIQMTPEQGGTMRILTDDMELAGDVLQEMTAALGVHELESSADFPLQMEAFRAVLLKVDEFNAARLKMTAEMADSSHAAKTLVIKAEDARILGDIAAVRSCYAQLYTLNAELIGEYNKRANNHEQLLAALKAVNQMIQAAARLRVGSAKTRVVSACRAAIKANNVNGLFCLIKTGKAG